MISPTLLTNNLVKHTSLEEGEIADILTYFTVKIIDSGTLLLKEGQICKEQVFINKGFLKAYFINEKGQVNNLLFGFEDFWMSDLASFVTQKPSIMTIEAVENTEVFAITFDNFQRILSKHPQLEKHFRILFQNAFVAQQRKSQQLFFHSIKERYENFLEMYAKFSNRIQLKDIASFIGSTPEHLSYLRSKKR